MVLTVLFRDPELVIVSKPSGLLVHRTSLAGDAEGFALQMVRDQIGTQVFPVHRLDRPTSGALVFALNRGMARALSGEFAARRVRKTYLAVARGVLREPFIRVNHPLREKLDPIADRKAAQGKEAQEALTEFELVDQVELPVRVDRFPTSRYCLVRAHPLTGRKHQIRRHLRHLGHPIIGDVNHGVGKHNRFFAERFAEKRLLLACTALGFRHPGTGDQILVKAPLDSGFAKVLHAFGWGRHVES